MRASEKSGGNFTAAGDKPFCLSGLAARTLPWGLIPLSGELIILSHAKDQCHVKVAEIAGYKHTYTTKI